MNWQLVHSDVAVTDDSGVISKSYIVIEKDGTQFQMGKILTAEDHMQFFLRIFFPISVGLFITSLERRKRLRENAELKTKIEKYLNGQ